MSGDARVRRCILTTLGSVKTYRPDIWETVLRRAPEVRGQVLVVQGAVDPLIQARERADEFVAAAAQRPPRGGPAGGSEPLLRRPAREAGCVRRRLAGGGGGGIRLSRRRGAWDKRQS